MDQDTLNLNSVDTTAGFSHFDAGLTEADQETLAKIRVADRGIYDNFGDIDAVKKDAEEFFKSLGNSPAEAEKQAEIIDRMVKRAVAGFSSETAWVAIRAFTPTDAYNVARWHTDGNFYGATGDQVKAVFTLKGASTLLHRVDEDQRKEITALELSASMNEMDETESRKRRAALLDPAKTETTPPGAGTVFIVGGNHATVHSEPPIASERVFVSVLPGTKAQIEQLQQGWNRRLKTEIRLGDQKPAKTKNLGP